MRALFELLRREFLYHLRLQCRHCNAITEHCDPNCPDRSNCCEDCEVAAR